MTELNAKIDDLWIHQNVISVHSILDEFCQILIFQLYLIIFGLMSSFTQFINDIIPPFLQSTHFSYICIWYDSVNSMLPCSHSFNPSKFYYLYMRNKREIEGMRTWQHKICEDWLHDDINCEYPKEWQHQVHIILEE